MAAATQVAVADAVLASVVDVPMADTQLLLSHVATTVESAVATLVVPAATKLVTVEDVADAGCSDDCSDVAADAVLRHR